MFEKISSPQNPKFKRALALHSSRGRKKQNRFIVFGWREVQRCIAAGLDVNEIFVCKAGDEVMANLEELSQKALNRFGTIEVAAAMMDKLGFGERMDPVVATVNRPKTTLEQLSVAGDTRVLVVESIEKPGNLGAIYRSADATGIDMVILADPMTDLFHPNSIRASMGTVFSLPTGVAETAEVLKWLYLNQCETFTARLDNAMDFYEADLTGRTAIALGNESRGLSEAWETFQALKLPMNGCSDSLNVSVTAAVMCYEMLRQRR